MNGNRDFEPEQIKPELDVISDAVRALADKCQGNSLAVLALLRSLEHLHREIREGVFQASLPDNRQALYALLRDIEEEGGWPYIDRMKLQLLLINVFDTSSPTNNPELEKQTVIED